MAVEHSPEKTLPKSIAQHAMQQDGLQKTLLRQDLRKNVKSN